MEQYYVSDRIIGVYFRSRKRLEDYYYRAVKLKDLSYGDVSIFETSSGLEEYIRRNQTNKNNTWKLG